MHPFRYYLRVRYGECDAQKVVFNARYAEYVDLGMSEFLRAAGLWEGMFHEYDFQLVKQTVEWKAPARFDDVLELSVVPLHLGTTSFSLITKFRIAGEDRVIVTAETVYVLVDAKTLTKTPLSDSFKASIQSGAADAVIDHAGYNSASSGG